MANYPGKTNALPGIYSAKVKCCACDNEEYYNSRMITRWTKVDPKDLRTRFYYYYYCPNCKTRMTGDLLKYHRDAKCNEENDSAPGGKDE